MKITLKKKSYPISSYSKGKSKFSVDLSGDYATLKKEFANVSEIGIIDNDGMVVEKISGLTFVSISENAEGVVTISFSYPEVSSFKDELVNVKDKCEALDNHISSQDEELNEMSELLATLLYGEYGLLAEEEE